MSHASDRDYRVFGLDALRALAILLVLLAHTWPSKSGTRFATAFAVLGVELFFVLSGFLIGGILLRLAEEGRLHKWKEVVGFWRRRWFRTLPNYYLFLGLHLAWRSWIVGFPDVLSTNWRYFLFLQNFRHGPPYFFPETWSLAIEEWFYLLFALILWLVLVRTGKPLRASIIVTVAFLVIPTALRAWYAIEQAAIPDTPEYTVLVRQTWDSDARRTVILRLDVVMYGVAGALLGARRPNRWKAVGKLWPVGLVLIFLAGSSIGWHWPLDRAKAWHGFALFPILGIGCGLLLPFFSHWHMRPGFFSNVISWIAKLSYSIYLCHGLVLLALARWFGRKSDWPLPPNTIEWCFAACMLSFVIAWIVYRFFERPLTQLRERFEKQPRRSYLHPNLGGVAPS